MRCPTLAELPTPPVGRTGWPWTHETPPAPDQMADSIPYPKITVVTPSYNQGAFIEETIRSVLLQGYPNLEYFVMDGGSTDETVEIIKKYEPWLTGWVSEPDHGQSHAINKGWSRATGDIVAWLNSDDLYASGALKRVAETYMKYGQPEVIAGQCAIARNGSVYKIRVCKAALLEGPMLQALLDIQDGWRAQHFFVQPEVFISRSCLSSVGLLDETQHYVMDYDLWIRIAMADGRFVATDHVLACFRKHVAQKTSDRVRITEEVVKVANAYLAKALEAGLISTQEAQALTEKNAKYFEQYKSNSLNVPQSYGKLTRIALRIARAVLPSTTLL